MESEKIICALDTSDLKQATEWVETLKDYIGTFKVGMELFYSQGLKILDILQDMNIPVFLDLKFCDIPNTVSRSISVFNKYNNIKMLTVHASGEKDMIEAAVLSTKIDVIAVTVLTSISSDNVSEIVEKRTEMALNAGAKGVVCSANEVVSLRNKFGCDFKIIVPGVRIDNSPGGDQNDQKRTGHPREIIKNGADYLVIGRPITQSDNPAITAKTFCDIIKEKADVKNK